MARRTDIDWEAIELDVRLGALSMRKIALKHGVSDSNLRARAARLGWQPDMAGAVRNAAKAAVITHTKAMAEEIGARTGAQQAQRYAGILQESAMSAAEIVAGHQLLTRRGVRLASLLLAELERSAASSLLLITELEHCHEQDPQRARLIDKLLSTRGQIESLERFANVLAKLTAIERTALGLDQASDTGKEELDTVLKRLAAERRAAAPVH